MVEALSDCEGVLKFQLYAPSSQKGVEAGGPAKRVASHGRGTELAKWRTQVRGGASRERAGKGEPVIQVRDHQSWAKAETVQRRGKCRTETCQAAQGLLVWAAEQGGFGMTLVFPWVVGPSPELGDIGEGRGTGVGGK